MDGQTGGKTNDVEFFGFHIKVDNPRLAALLNSDVNENVEVIGNRGRSLFGEDGVLASAEAGDEVGVD